jgi:hypothetical protein
VGSTGCRPQPRMSMFQQQLHKPVHSAGSLGLSATADPSEGKQISIIDEGGCDNDHNGRHRHRGGCGRCSQESESGNPTKKDFQYFYRAVTHMKETAAACLALPPRYEKKGFCIAIAYDLLFSILKAISGFVRSCRDIVVDCLMSRPCMVAQADPLVPHVFLTQE